MANFERIIAVLSILEKGFFAVAYIISRVNDYFSDLKKGSWQKPGNNYLLIVFNLRRTVQINKFDGCLKNRTQVCLELKEYKFTLYTRIEQKKINLSYITMFSKFSALVVFLILGLVAPICASGPCSCQTLPKHVGTITGNLNDLIDDVVSDVIEPVGSAVTSLIDNLLSGIGVSGLLGDILGSEGVDLDGLVGSEGIDLGDVVSEVEDLIEDLLDISNCPDLDVLQNNLFYHFNSGRANHLVLHGFSGNHPGSISVALFTGVCDDLSCVYSEIDFCENSNLAIEVEPFTEYYLAVFGAGCEFVIDYDLSCHGNCGSCQTCN